MAQYPSNLSPLQEGERSIIEFYLTKNRGNKSKSSRELGISINTLKAKMRRYDLEKPSTRDSVYELFGETGQEGAELRLVKR